MNDQADVDAILERFRDWLEDARIAAYHSEETGSALETEGGAARDFGIIDLVEEFTALRHELKLQTKSGRGLIEQTDNSISALKQATEQLQSVDAREAQAAWSTGKALAEALADLDEALVRGQREIDRARRQIADESVRALETALNDLFRRRSWVRRRVVRAYHREVMETVRHDGAARHELFESFLEGYRLIQNRLRRALASEQVARIPCEGKPVDPELMSVIEVVDEPRDRAGTVVRELRRGYTWRGRVIRFAEVQAVRGASQPAAVPDAEDADEMAPDGAQTERIQESTNGPAQLGQSED